MAAEEGDFSELSASSSDSDEGQNEPHNRRPKQWLPYRVLGSAHEISLFFQEESFWKVKTKVTLVVGEKTSYYCNKEGRGANKCPAMLSKLKKNDACNTIFQISGEHVHTEMQRKLDPRVREKIAECVENGMKQRAISHELRSNADFPVKPTKNQVSYCVFLFSMSFTKSTSIDCNFFKSLPFRNQK